VYVCAHVYVGVMHVGMWVYVNVQVSVVGVLCVIVCFVWVRVCALRVHYVRFECALCVLVVFCAALRVCFECVSVGVWCGPCVCVLWLFPVFRVRP
jgi:hypothetical protein